MTARSEIHPDTKAKTPVYVCSSYIAGRINGHPSPCGYHAVRHSVAEQMLLDKITELHLPFDPDASSIARANLKAGLRRLDDADDEERELVLEEVEQGVNAFLAYLTECGTPPQTLAKLRTVGRRFYRYGGKVPGVRGERLPLALGELKKAVQDAEAKRVASARERLAKIMEEHKSITLAWARATTSMQDHLKGEIDRLEQDAKELKAATVPLSERLRSMFQEEQAREAERRKLLNEWPGMDCRERGESMRRLFKTVTLFWEKTWQGASSKPARPRKTNRPGRWRYSVKQDATRWDLAPSQLESSS